MKIANPKVTARKIEDYLIRIHRENGWRAEREIRFFPRRIDVLAISPGAKDVVGYEVKVRREDYQSEIRNPEKRRGVMRFCTQFYFVIPASLEPQVQMPTDCGLVLLYEDGWTLPLRFMTGWHDQPLPLDMPF